MIWYLRFQNQAFLRNQPSEPWWNCPLKWQLPRQQKMPEFTCTVYRKRP
jgi:hypothetical protein